MPAMFFSSPPPAASFILRMVNHTRFAWEINSIIKHAALQKFQLPTAARGRRGGEKKKECAPALMHEYCIRAERER